MNLRLIGYYVHHRGAGHWARARAIAPHLDRPCTLIGTLAGHDRAEAQQVADQVGHRERDVLAQQHRAEDDSHGRVGGEVRRQGRPQRPDLEGELGQRHPGTAEQQHADQWDHPAGRREQRVEPVRTDPVRRRVDHHRERPEVAAGDGAVDRATNRPSTSGGEQHEQTTDHQHGEHRHRDVARSRHALGGRFADQGQERAEAAEHPDTAEIARTVRFGPAHQDADAERHRQHQHDEGLDENHVAGRQRDDVADETEEVPGDREQEDRMADQAHQPLGALLAGVGLLLGDPVLDDDRGPVDDRRRHAEGHGEGEVHVLQGNGRSSGHR